MLSYNVVSIYCLKSGLAMEVVLGHIATRMPQTAALMDKIMCTVSEVGL